MFSNARIHEEFIRATEVATALRLAGKSIIDRVLTKMVLFDLLIHSDTNLLPPIWPEGQLSAIHLD